MARDANGRRRSPIVRQWQLIQAMNRRQRGATIAQLVEAAAASRATVYRDLGQLRQAGIPIGCDRVNGEARYRLDDWDLPPLRITPLQHAGLQLAQRSMRALVGTRLARELDALLAAAGDPGADGHVDRHLSIRGGPHHDPALIATLDRALRKGVQLRLRYRGRKDAAPSPRRVDPLSLRLVGDQLYLVAFDHDRAAPRTFKVPRIGHAQLLDQKAADHPDIDLDALYRDAVRIWHGEPTEVVVRLDPSVARLASEWPLHRSQALEPQPDGAILVRATVAGTTETMRWCLGWGKAAQALNPPELVAAIAAELHAAAAHYHQDNVSRSVRQPATRDRHGAE